MVSNITNSTSSSEKNFYFCPGVPNFDFSKELPTKINTLTYSKGVFSSTT